MYKNNNTGEEPTAKDSLLIENQYAIRALRRELEKQQLIHNNEMEELRKLIRNLRSTVEQWTRANSDLYNQIERQKFNPNKMYDGIQEV